MAKRRIGEISDKVEGNPATWGSASKVVSSWRTEIWKTFDDEKSFTDYYEESFQSLFTPRELDIDRELIYKIQDIKELFKDLKIKYKEWALKDNLELNKAVEEKIISCFWIFEDDNFDPKKYNQLNDYLAFWLLYDLFEEFKIRFSAFLELKSDMKHISKKELVQDVQNFSNEFFDIYVISERKKSAYKAAICMACMSINYFDLEFFDFDK